MQIECVGCGATADGYIDGECAGCAEITARNALAAARDDVLRAAKVRAGSYHSTGCDTWENGPCSCGHVELRAAVDRRAKLEGTKS